jgi:chemotaxis protein methyltransferase CheR
VDTEDLEVRLLLEAIAAKYGHDLRGYRTASLKRRIQHALTKSGAANLGQLQHQVLHDADLFASVLDDLTVQVSEMFRDPPIYRTFREEIVPMLRTYPQVRIWHAGCSSGEEVYTTAILLAEEGLSDRTQIYATDLSNAALARAREGVYPAERAAAYAANYHASGGTRAFETYYSVAYDHIALDESLRKNIVFFQHDLVADHAFGQMQVIFCRNVLIYFERALRMRVLDKFSAGLCRGGFVVLGNSEQLGRPEEGLGFVEFDAATRIYRYRGNGETLAEEIP